ncbi:MAG: hydantoinase B/oxoprolinase family protein [bacterium]|nr:hydantoinase B/oxoprolinase family protein [bacterium]
MVRKGIDAITLEVLWSRLIAIAEEAATEIVRTSFSTTVREAQTFALVLLDTKGNSIAQAGSTMPSYVGALPITAKNLLKIFPPESFRPDDLVLTNDPWMGTGHLQDISSLTPIFHKKNIIGFTGITTHVTDMGGKLRSPEVREIYEEGLQLPACKYVSEGEVNPDILRIIRANVRVPELVEGDLISHMVAGKLASKRVQEMLEEYKLRDLDAIASTIYQRSENAMREAIKKVPDGEYRFQVNTDGYDEPLAIRVEVRVRGSSILVDYTGSSPQVDRGLNATLNYVFAYSAYSLKCLFCPQVPNNEGNFRPITVSAPEGSILNPRYPAPVNGRSMVGHFIPSAIFGALCKAVPALVPSASGSPTWAINAAGVDNQGKRFAGNFYFNGGQGASKEHDGRACLCFPSNTSNTPIEVLEHIVPLLVERKAVNRDSGGAGEFVGGNGQQVIVKSLSEGAILLTFLSERTRHPAYGLFGGRNGRVGKVTLNGRPINPKRQWVMNPGDRLVLDVPSGGGYGDPKDRSRGRIEHDLQEGLISLQKARTEYGYEGEYAHPFG